MRWWHLFRFGIVSRHCGWELGGRNGSAVFDIMLVILGIVVGFVAPCKTIMGIMGRGKVGGVKTGRGGGIRVAIEHQPIIIIVVVVIIMVSVIMTEEVFSEIKSQLATYTAPTRIAIESGMGGIMAFKINHFFMASGARL